ncbi:MAG TPA: hypothetical protein V6D29_20820 [Leptolyngbyaceae cyanobacterium]
MGRLLTVQEWAAVEAHCAQLEAVGKAEKAQSIRHSIEWLNHAPPREITSAKQTSSGWVIEFDTEAEATRWMKICMDASGGYSAIFQRTGATVTVKGRLFHSTNK